MLWPHYKSGLESLTEVGRKGGGGRGGEQLKFLLAFFEFINVENVVQIT